MLLTPDPKTLSKTPYVLALALLVSTGCGDDSTFDRPDVALDGATRCATGVDPDGDSIPLEFEGVADTDGDGTPNFERRCGRFQGAHHADRACRFGQDGRSEE
ncbi:MAG: hypothetical protein AAF411_07650, partial [Myxococcota bacterium]